MKEKGINLLVVLNTLGHFAKLQKEDKYFNSPDFNYFDGSALGYWTRKAIEFRGHFGGNKDGFFK